MSVFDSPPAGFYSGHDGLGRSPHDEPLSVSTGEYADRSTQPSIDFFTDLSPNSEPMTHTLSTGASSNDSLALSSFEFGYELAAAAQMSNNFGAGDMFQQALLMNPSQNFQGSSAAFGPALTTPAGPAGLPTRPGQPSQFGQIAQNQHLSPTHSRGLPNSQWSTSASYGSSVKIESPTGEELLSGVPTTADWSQDPWSAAAPSRFAGHSLQQHTSVGPVPQNTLDVAHSHSGGSVISYDSSPLVEPIHTPESSSRSPMFPHSNPYSSSAGSASADGTGNLHFQGIQQIPQQAQYGGFQPQAFNNVPGSAALQDLMVDPYIYPPGYAERLSPSDGGFEMIEHSEAQMHEQYNQPMTNNPPPKEKKQSVQRTKKISTGKARTNNTVFVPEYPTNKRRRSNDAAVSKMKDGKRAGGRSVGMHLSTEQAARAKQLRDEGSCWICCFQRDSCSLGDTCDRCVKRTLRNQTEHGLGCDRTKLQELQGDFIPNFLSRSGDRAALKQFMGNHVLRWNDKPLKLRINIIWGQKPMVLELYEFQPKDAALVSHLQNVLDEKSGKRSWVNKRSPPIALVAIEEEDRQQYEKWVNSVVDNRDNLQDFVSRCYRYEKDDFQARLFQLMFEYSPRAKDEKELLRELFRLQVITYIYSRASTISPGDLYLLDTLQFTAINRVKYERATTARLANRQLKYLYTSLWIETMQRVLKKLQQVLRSSRGGKWSTAFCAVLGLAMAFETIQQCAHSHQEADSMMGNQAPWEAKDRAEAACRTIDDKFTFLTTLFRWKYHKGFNPLTNLHDRNVQEALGPEAVEFVQAIDDLMHEKGEYLLYREMVPAIKENQDFYTSRLVARFLFSFRKNVN